MSDEIPQEYTANYEQFRDILSSYLIERIALPQAKPTAKSRRRSKKPTPSVATPEPASPESALEPTSSSDAEDLADFTTYIATAIFRMLTREVHTPAGHIGSATAPRQHLALLINLAR